MTTTQFNTDIRSITVGTQLFAIDGPGQFPSSGLCATSGVVVARKETRWGFELEVLCGDGSTQSVHGLSTTGIGWYASEND